jgi:hypothetical protein
MDVRSFLRTDKRVGGVTADGYECHRSHVRGKIVGSDRANETAELRGRLAR